MDIDKIVDQLLDETSASSGSATATTSADGAEITRKRERLAGVVAGGQSERYLGRILSLDQIDRLSPPEVEKLYARYEMFFGASICKTLGHAVLTMYSDLAAYYRPEIDPNSLSANLTNNPIVELGVSGYSGSLHHRFGWLLTPIVVAITTIKHCKLGKDLPKIDGVSSDRDTRASSGRESTSQEP
jgi:hypothetical protein